MATEQDFDDLVENPVLGSGVSLMGGTTPQWPRLVRIARWAKALFRAAVITNDYLGEFHFGDPASTTKSRFRFIVSNGGTRIRLDRNTNTDASPTWVTLFIWDNTGLTAGDNLSLVGSSITSVRKATFTGLSGVAIDAGNQRVINVSELQAALITILSSLDMGGHPITNAGAITCGAVNGFTLGGVVTPQPVGAANTPGINGTFARTDHAHRGVQELDTDGAGDLAGVVNLVSYDRIAITRSGQDVRFAYSPRKVYQDNASGANQTAIAGNTETNVTGLNGITITGADGARTFRLSMKINVECSGGSSLVGVYVYVGANGTLADGAGARVAAAWVHSDGGLRSIVIPELQITPAAATKIGVAVIFSNAAVTGTVRRVAPEHGHLALHHV